MTTQLKSALGCTPGSFPTGRSKQGRCRSSQRGGISGLGLGGIRLPGARMRGFRGSSGGIEPSWSPCGHRWQTHDGWKNALKRLRDSKQTGEWDTALKSRLRFVGAKGRQSELRSRIWHQRNQSPGCGRLEANSHVSRLAIDYQCWFAQLPFVLSSR